MGCCGRGGLHFGQIGSCYGVLFAREPANPSANLRCRLADLQRCRELEECQCSALPLISLTRRAEASTAGSAGASSQTGGHTDGHHQESG